MMAGESPAADAEDDAGMMDSRRSIDGWLAVH